MWGLTGNYSLSVEWNDGHSSLYPYQHIRALIEEEEKKKRKKNRREIITLSVITIPMMALRYLELL